MSDSTLDCSSSLSADAEPTRVGAMRSALVWTTSRWRWWIGLAIVLALVVLPTFPGRANHDTDTMVADMDVGVYWDWWSPVLMMMWRPLFELGVGIGYIQIGTVAALFAALGSLVRPLFVKQWPAIITTSALCIFPTTYTMLISVIRDTWFTVAIVSTLAVIYRTRRPAPIHGALVALGFFLIVATRQNGVLVVMVLVFAASVNWGVLRHRHSTLRRVLTWSALSVVCGFAVIAGMRVVYLVTDVVPTGPETATFYVDLDEMSPRVGEMLVPSVFFREPVTLPDLAVSRNYTPDEIRNRVILRLPVEDRPVAQQAWRDAVVEYPYVYLQSRWQMFTRQLGWSGAPPESHYPTDGTSTLFHPRSPQLSELSTSYLEMFDGGSWSEGGFLHRPWIFVATAAVAAVRWGRRWPMLFAVLATQFGVLASLVFLSPVSKARLAFPVFVLGTVAGVYLLLGGRAVLEERLRSRDDAAIAQNQPVS